MEYKKGQEDIIKRAKVINERAENINKQFVKVQVRKGNADIATPKNIIEIKANKQISDNSMEILERAKALNARISKKPRTPIHKSPIKPNKVLGVSADSGQLEEFELLFTQKTK